MREPTVRKCPICGKVTAGGECFSCGFVFPNEEEIAAPYDLDPSNDLFGEAAAEKTSAPAMETLDMDAAVQSLELPKMESLSVGSVNPVGAGLKSPAYPPPNIKVRNAAPPAYPSPAAQPKPQPLNNNPPPPPAYPVYQTTDPLTSFVKAVSDFVTAHWWQFLLTLLLPTVGLGFGAYYLTKFKANRLIRDLLFGIGFLLASMILWIKGVDILGLDFYLRELLDRDYYY